MNLSDRTLTFSAPAGAGALPGTGVGVMPIVGRNDFNRAAPGGGGALMMIQVYKIRKNEK